MMKKKIIFGLILCAVLSVIEINPVKDVKAADVYTTEQITQFITNKEYPAEEGKIFAGWYNGETPVKSTADVTDTTVPKFVDDDVLTVKFQILEETTTESTTTDVRFLTSVDSLNYKSVEFEVTLNKTITTPVNKVYTSVNAEGEKFTPKEVFSEDSNYIATLLMTDFTKDSTESDEYGYWGKTITVTPKWTTMDGTTVTGKTRQIEVNDGLYDTEVNSESTRTWHTLTEGIAEVNGSAEDVTLTILQDVEITERITVNNINGKNITLDGHGHTATMTKGIFIYQQTGTVDVKNMIMKHSLGEPVFRIGENKQTYSGELIVNLNNLDIESTSACVAGLIQAGYATMTLDLNMTDVNLSWETTETVTGGAVTAGNQVTTALDLTMTGCEIDVSKANNAKAIHANNVATGTINLIDTKITTAVDTPVSYNNMTLSIDKDTTFYQGETQSVALVDGVQYSQLADAVTAMNAKTTDTTMNLVKDVTIEERITIKNTNVQNITLDGGGHTATMTKGIFIYQQTGTVDVKNMIMKHSLGEPVFRIGENNQTYSGELIVNLNNLDIESTSTCVAGLIQAGYATMTLDLNMTDVNLSWETTETVTGGAVTAGNKVTTALDLTMTGCEIDVSKANNAKAIHANNVATGTINLIDTKITTAVDTPVYNNKMTFSSDNDE